MELSITPHTWWGYLQSLWKCL